MSKTHTARDPKEWTLMFYFASDNPLAPSIVSQLKAIKNAGFHPEANVVARFDPHTENTPLHTFDVNLFLKHETRVKRAALAEAVARLGASADDHTGELLEDARRHLATHRTHQVGFRSNDPFVRNLVFDRLWGDEKVPDENGQEVKVNDRLREKLRNSVSYFLAEKLNGRDRPALSDEDIAGIVDSDGLLAFDPPDPSPPPAASRKSGRKKAPRRAGGNGGGSEEHDKVEPAHALDEFLKFCAREYPAKHYMLFILGHGLVVGNDMFLLDEHAAKPSLSLKELGDTLHKFNQEYKTAGALELVGFHSCSMNSVEVAYQLRGEARYMLGSQGPEFVGSWPYTQILVRVFNDLVRKKKDEEFGEEEIAETVKKIFFYCFYNSYDFQMAGYSFDLSLCDLSKTPGVTRFTKDLASELVGALGDKKNGDGGGRKEGGGVVNEGDEFIKGLILLAHWDAQSFWRDTYTDLYDFCLCLQRRCKVAAQASEETRARLGRIYTACEGLMKSLLGEDGLVVQTGFAGPSYQYSHGLSVFFPWSEPANKDFWGENKEYAGYRFAQETTWGDFLQRYFDNTMRDPRRDEEGHEQARSARGRNGGLDELDAQLLEGITARTFEQAEASQLGKGSGSDAMGKGSGSDATGKGSGSDASGGDCDCPSIKNYPSTTRGRSKKATSVCLPGRKAF